MLTYVCVKMRWIWWMKSDGDEIFLLCGTARLITSHRELRLAAIRHDGAARRVLSNKFGARSEQIADVPFT